MKQVCQDRRTGRIEIAEVAEPSLQPGCLLVRTAFSAVSPGTERAALRLSRASLLETARERPDLVRRAIDLARRDGPLAAWRKVREKRSGSQALGYSSAGTVLAVGAGAESAFRVGDRVACAGFGFAVHGELACVPASLAARVPDGLALDAAAFATLAAIALHAVRQADVQVGERAAVIGLGLVGQLAAQILGASGCRTVGFDVDPERVARARELGIEEARAADAEEQVAAALSWSGGVGVDAVLVTAGAPDEALMAAAAGMARDRGRVVAVGLVPFGLPRELAYEKELELRVSRSLGPGRYDDDFELKGRDLPIGHVRWTETRNLEAVLQLMADGRLDPLRLVTDRRLVGDAAELYDRLLGEPAERPLGALLEYPEAVGASEERRPTAAPAPAPAPTRPVRPRAGDPLGVGFVGAGAFAGSVLLPLLARRQDVRLRRVVTRQGLSARDAAERFGFEHAGASVDELFADEGVHLACIATRHDSHAELAIAGLESGRAVFVEKPLALDEEELARVAAAARAGPGTLAVGWNRRFAPQAVALREAFDRRGPLALLVRVNAGALPADHWLNDPDVGGGRLLGEASHFLDLLSFLTGDQPFASVQAHPVGRSRTPAESAGLLVSFTDGSVGQVLYTAGGAPALGKERIEVHAEGVSAVVEDFRRGTLVSGRRRRRLSGSGKGHAEELGRHPDSGATVHRSPWIVHFRRTSPRQGRGRFHGLQFPRPNADEAKTWTARMQESPRP